jgi:Tol biopolymer transport system component
MILVAAVGAVVAAVAAGVLVQSARATYPGDVGRLAFGMRDSSGNAQIFTANPNGAGTHQLTTGDGFNVCAAYSPDGKQIAFCSGRTGTFQIWAMKQNGHDLHQVTKQPDGFAIFPDYSPDGSKIAFSGTEGSAPTDQVYVVDSDGNGLQALTNDASNNDYPAYSPDGSKIAFISDRTGVEQVWEMNSDGSDPHQLTHSGVTNDQLPDWSPDGTKIAYEQGDSPNGHIFVMNANGSNPVQLTNSNGDDFGAAWSPDGTQIAFVRDYGDGDRPVMVMNADGSSQHQLMPGSWTGFVPAWQPLGAGG